MINWVDFLKKNKIYFYVFILGWFVFFEFINPISKVLIGYFTGDLFRDLKGFSDLAFQAHEKMLTLSFVLLLYVCFKKTVSFFEFLLLNVIVFLGNIYEFLDKYVHAALFKLGLFNSFLREGAIEINPQYTRILVFLICYLAIIGILTFKNKRSIDRAFMLIISSSVLITTFLFHIAIPMGFLSFYKNEKIELIMSDAKYNEKKYFCSNKKCSLVSQEDFVKSGNSEHIKISGNFVGTESVISGCVLRKEERNYLCFSDSQSLLSMGYLSKIWFALLTAVAHGVWIYFGFFFLFLHKRKAIRKLVGA